MIENNGKLRLITEACREFDGVTKMLVILREASKIEEASLLTHSVVLWEETDELKCQMKKQYIVVFHQLNHEPYLPNMVS